MILNSFFDSKHETREGYSVVKRSLISEIFKIKEQKYLSDISKILNPKEKYYIIRQRQYSGFTEWWHDYIFVQIFLNVLYRVTLREFDDLYFF